jgi:hypothetical protein
MIHESYPWKRELLRDAEILDRWAERTRHTERRDVLFERKLFISAYSIRKLIEARKLSTDIEKLRLGCDLFPWTGKPLDFMNNHHIDKAFDLENGRPSTVSLRDVANLIIHSLVLVFQFDEDDRIVGFLCTSEVKQRIGLYAISMASFIALMRKVGADYPSNSSFVRGQDGLIDVFWAGHGEPPPSVQNKLDAALKKRIQSERS